ncbi:hypothetical protein [Natronoarchaeum rubrum]|uniref:hypothetical protein n=1 Tax=Natronoarchaeum rubrum TaxID=755311 RepID=UPI0021137099|nr:hypothetical protein [Natronoarchaeum rubrum]HMB51301.1 hypothetical protein [Natronoarchaeum rubrum]
MDLTDVRRRAAAYDSLLGAVLVVVYLLTVTVLGAVLAGDPTSNTPIVSDAAALALVAHAYSRDRFPELGTSLVVALILLAWLLAFEPAVPLLDAVTGLPGWLQGDAGTPLVLAAVLVVAYALVVRGVVPTPNFDGSRN